MLEKAELRQIRIHDLRQTYAAAQTLRHVMTRHSGTEQYRRSEVASLHGSCVAPLRECGVRSMNPVDRD